MVDRTHLPARPQVHRARDRGARDGRAAVDQALSLLSEYEVRRAVRTLLNQRRRSEAGLRRGSGWRTDTDRHANDAIAVVASQPIGSSAVGRAMPVASRTRFASALPLSNSARRRAISSGDRRSMLQ